MSDRGGISRSDYVALAAFRHALRRFTAFSADAAHAAGLTPQQHQALLAIKGAPAGQAVGVGDIAKSLLIRPQSAVELVDRLMALGLVARIADPADHRRVQVALTPRAEATLERLSEDHLRELQAIRPALLSLLELFEPEA
jgi:DNA-binding MarR family transcriptional regulator